MLVVIIYDISDDRKRDRVAKLLMRMGLRRIQKSAFIGNITFARAKDIARASEHLIDLDTDILHIIPVNKIDTKRIIVVGNPRWASGAPSDWVLQ